MFEVKEKKRSLKLVVTLFIELAYLQKQFPFFLNGCFVIQFLSLYLFKVSIISPSFNIPIHQFTKVSIF